MSNSRNKISFGFQEEHKEIREYFSDESLFEGHRIRIIGKLGEGKHSKTFRAEMDGKRVTIKVDERDLFQDEKEIRNKIDALKTLNHSRIGRVLDFIRDTEHNRSYIIMEFVNGIGLDAALEEKRGGCFPQHLALEWGCQILDALCYLHKNFIHGDVKLSNIVRRRDDSVCLSDFSYLVDDPEDEVEVNSNNPDDMDFTAITDFFGTPRDPALFQREIQRDIYRVGDVLFQLLTGQKAVKGESDEDKKKRLTDKGVFPPVADVLLKALSKNPKKRWQSANEMKDALLSLPLRDSRRRKYMLSVIVQVFLIFLVAVAGFGLYRGGQYKARRTNEMEKATAAALSEWEQGAYSEAFRDISTSLEKHPLDPECAPDTLKAAAEILGAYDYTDGYRPFYSVNQFGEPLSFAISPLETRFAVLTEETTGLSVSVRRLHILDALTGVELGAPLEVSSAAGFEFLNEDTFLYINRNGNLAAYDLDANADSYTVGNNVLRFALSGNKATVGFISGDNGNEKLTAYVSRITERFQFTQPQSISLTDEADAENCLFALNYDGSCLAVSLARGNTADAENRKGFLRIYSFTEIGNTDSAFSTDVDIEHPYEHCEGGFCGNYLGYAAWTKREASDDYLSERGVYQLINDGKAISHEFVMRAALYQQVYAAVDENGLYFASESTIVCAEPEKRYWKSFPSVEGKISLLRHRAGRVLAVTDGNRAYVCDDDGDKLNLVSDGFALPCAAISERYLTLCGRSAISVQKWTNGSEKALSSIEYDKDYGHLMFNVMEDKASAMLYGGEDLFRIYGADSSKKGGGSDELADGVLRLKYLRTPELDGEPEQECLRVDYDDKTAYYAASDGEVLLETEPVADTGVLTADYRIEYRAGGTVEIYERDGSIPLKSLTVEGRLADAFQTAGNPEILLVSLLSNDDQSAALLLDGDLEIIAELSGSFTVLADGTLYYDDREGALLEGKFYDRADLAEDAKRALNARDEGTENP